jgi:starch synthase
VTRKPPPKRKPAPPKIAVARAVKPTAKAAAAPAQDPAAGKVPPGKVPPAKAPVPSAPPVVAHRASPLASGPARDPVVLWLAAEAVPWAHTGGLGDVVGSLPAVLRTKGWDVRLCLPLYADARRFAMGPALLELEIPVGHGRSRVPIAVRAAIDPPGGVPTYFIECPLFERPGVYGDGGQAYPDNPYRYGVWQLAARELAASLEPTPALIHCHDWHAALTPALVKMPGQWPGGAALAREAGADGDGISRAARALRTIFTIHNLEFQGHTARAALDDLGLPREFWHPQWLEHFAGVNFLKGAILSADQVTTVSRSYADEIRTPAFGMGLDGPLRDRGADVTGIVNGIDVVSWDPATDPALPAHFDADHRAGRATCKAALWREWGLPGTADDPLIGFVGRITESKGVDLLVGALPSLFALGARAVVLGNGDLPLHAALQALQHAYPEHFRVVLRFDAALARRTYAGVDTMIVPSRVEPCGLVQLYSLRYGAVPIVHAVGGLRDTVTDGQTGFVFEDPTVRSIVAAVRRALEVFSEQPARWAEMVTAGMRQDWSWANSATGYDALYRETLRKPPRVRPLPAPEDDHALFIDFGPALPAVLGRDQLRLLAQGPSCLYAYWEMDSAEPLDLIIEERPTGYAFVLSEQAAPTGEFWLPVLPEHAYRAMFCRRDGSIVRLSNIVLTGRDRAVPADEATPVWIERLLASGALDDPNTADRWSTIFPQRPTRLRGTRYWGGALPGELAAASVLGPDVDVGPPAFGPPSSHTLVSPPSPASASSLLPDRERWRP